MAKNTAAISSKQAEPSPRKSFNFSKEEKISYYVLAATLLLAAYIRSNFLLIPFERDEGIYAYFGKLLLEGGVPYKDFSEQKFPGIFYFFAFMVGTFGDTVKGVHTGFMLLNLATIVVVFFASKKMFSPLAGAVSALTYAVVSLTPNLSGFTIQSEHGVAFFVSLGIYFYAVTLKNKKWLPYFLMGLAMGCAFMVKTSGMFLVFWGGVALIIDVCFDKDNRTWKEFFRRTLLYSAGVLLVVGVLFLIIFLKGSFNEMIYWAYYIPKRYVGKMKWEEGKTYLGYTYTAITKEYKFFWGHAALALAVVLLKNFSWRLKFVIITLMGSSVITIFPGYFFYGHYWIQILPGLSILSGLTFYVINELLKERMGVTTPKLKYGYLALFLALTFMHLHKLKDYYFRPNFDLILRNVYGSNPFPETMRIADYINANSKPEDNIVAIGSEPEIYFYTKKKCPSRHAYFSALVDNVPEHKEWQREFVRDVEKAKPRYIVFYNNRISLLVQPDTDKYIWEWYDKYIKDYNIIGCIDMVDGYVMATYAWKEQLTNFKPAGQNVIYIYERKPEAS